MPYLSHTLRLKVSLGVSLALVLLLAPFNWIQYESQRRSALRELESLAVATGAVVEHSLKEAMMGHNRTAIQAIVDGAAQAPGIQSIYLIDLQGLVAASPDRQHNGEILDQTSGTCATCHQLPVAERPRGIVVVDENDQAVFRTMTPIPNQTRCHSCHDPTDRLNGVFYMDFSMAGLQARLQQGLRTAFLGSVAIIVLCAVVLYFLLSWLFITPMERITQGIQRFSRGDRSARVSIETRDEVGVLASAFNDMAGTIQQQEIEATRLYSEIQAKDIGRRQLLDKLITAREEEHIRLARRIHDELGQLLTGLSLHLKLCEQALPAGLDVAHQHISRAASLVQSTMEQAHFLIRQLRPTALDDYGLAPALKGELQQRLGPLGIEAHLESADSLEPLPAPVKTAAFRIAQEAMINIVRHAQAGEVWVRLSRNGQGLHVTVEDDGAGFVGRKDANGGPGNEKQSGGLGILGMQERAEALGGRVEITQRAPRGTVVHLWLPLNDSQQENTLDSDDQPAVQNQSGDWE